MRKRNDTELWNRAKEIGKNKTSATDWTYIFSVYQYLGGNKIGINVLHNNQKYRIVGSLSENVSLILNLKSLVVEEVPAKEVTLDKKEFVETDPKELLYTYSHSKIPKNTINPSLISGKDIKIYSEAGNDETI